MIFGFAWRMTGSTPMAEDVTQEAFLVLLRHPERFDPLRGTLRAFLLGVARNRVLKRWGGENRSVALADDAGAVSPSTGAPRRPTA